jgi:betaine lipid synthase
MSAFVSVPDFFSHVYLVDLSPSLCEIARQRFERLGWKNVNVVCQDARTFRLPQDNVEPGKTSVAGADVVTMSYSLSMIPGKRSSLL